MPCRFRIINHSISRSKGEKEREREILTARDATRQRGGVPLLVGPRRPVHYPPPLVQDGGLFRRHWKKRRKRKILAFSLVNDRGGWKNFYSQLWINIFNISPRKRGYLAGYFSLFFERYSTLYLRFVPASSLSLSR